MRLQSISSVFTRHRADASVSKDATKASPSFDARYTKTEQIGSSSGWTSYYPKTCQSDVTSLRELVPYLPHTLITSDLGQWGQIYHLQFSHFLPEDPAIAVFLKSQDAPVPTTWRHKQSWRPWRLNICWRWRNGRLQVRSSCTVMVNVGSRWEHKISMQAVQYWSASAGVLLVEWSDMYNDYFAHDGKKKNNRAHVIVRQLRKPKERTLSHW
jgi:hypothetical protein